MNADGCASPKPGTRLSFSAGSGLSLPVRYRVVAQSGDRTQDILRTFPQFVPLLGNRPPILANAYPATLGEFPSAVSVDICQRPANAWRALALAAELNLAIVFTGQPLYVAELLRSYSAMDLPWPGVVVAALGGYACPASLQGFMTALPPEGVVKLVLHCYGMAEADFACLVGVDREANGSVRYRAVSRRFIAQTNSEGRLLLVDTNCGEKMDTGDSGRLLQGAPDAFVILNSGVRLDPDLLRELEGWGPDKWIRRTGHACRIAGTWRFQLREGEDPVDDTEIEHFDFWRITGLSWTEKPTWGKP